MLPDPAEVCAALPEPAARWLRDALERVPADRRAFAASWGMAGRRLGTAPVRGVWAADEAGRALLLARALPADARAFVMDLYEKGELREQLALLKALPFLPDPARFADVATAAVRSNALAVLEAIASENPYPAAHLGDAAYNQLVLKALMGGIAVARLAGLERRRNPELVRMVAAWVRERRLAGRSVAADVEHFLQGEADAAL